MTGSFADLLRQEAEATRPTQSRFVRGFVAVSLQPRLLGRPQRSPGRAAGAAWEGSPGARGTASFRPRAEAGMPWGTQRAPVVSLQPNSERPAPVSTVVDWPAGGGAIVRQTNWSPVSHALFWPRPRGRPRGRSDRSHWPIPSAGARTGGAAPPPSGSQFCSAAVVLVPAAPGFRRSRNVPSQSWRPGTSVAGEYRGLGARAGWPEPPRGLR